MSTDPSIVRTVEEVDPLAEHLAKALAGELKLVRKLGQGRTALVYLAEEPALGRYVAVKALKPTHSNDPTTVERFKREARAMAGCPHPNIVPVHKVGETEAGVPLFTMAYVEGETLERRLQRKGKLPLPEAVRITRGIAAGLARAHELGLVHRDVKPADVLIENDTGRVMVADFGLAKLKASDQRIATLTGQGEVLGLPQYTSPEQAERGAASPKNDQYSLGVIAYEMLSGRLPFLGPREKDYLRQHVEDTPPFLLRLEPTLPPEVAKVIDRALMKEPEARFGSTDAFAEALSSAASVSAEPSTVADEPFEWWRYQRLAIQALAIYAGVSWGILEVLTWVLETFNVSADFRRPALWLVLAAFPIVLLFIYLQARSRERAPRAPRRYV